MRTRKASIVLPFTPLLCNCSLAQGPPAPGRNALLKSPGFGFDKILFSRRFTYTANHYYTEYVNSRWTPGGNLCVLDLKTGRATELV